LHPSLDTGTHAILLGQVSDTISSAALSLIYADPARRRITADARNRLHRSLA
jgi:hypothetical protein